MSRALQSPRLSYTPLISEDGDELHQLWISPGVRRFLWDDVIIERAQTAAILRENEGLFAQHGYGLWGARLLGEEPLCGFTGFWHFHEPPVLEILFGLAEPFWGQGLATEMAQTMVEFGLRECGWSVIRGSTDYENGASTRVMDKLGFKQVRRAASGGLDTLFYELIPD